MSHTMTHTVVKNDKKEVTGYEIRADAVLVGMARKSDKGKFLFEPVKGALSGEFDSKVEHATMAGLKIAVDKVTDAAYVKANVTAKSPAPKKAPKKIEAANIDAELAAADAGVEGAKPGDPASDIDLE